MEAIQAEPFVERSYKTPSNLRASAKGVIEPRSVKLQRPASSAFPVAVQGSMALATAIAGTITRDLELIFDVVQGAAAAKGRPALLGATASVPVLVQTEWNPVLPEATHKQSPAAKLRVDRIAEIQGALGVPMQTLAGILKISRPCLYKWIDAEQAITLQPDNRERLAAIEQVAAQWRGRSSAPLSSVAHEPVRGGKTVLELLGADVLDKRAIAAAFELLANKLGTQPKTRSQRMAEAGFRRRPTHRSLPKDE
jgi:hypothetical protein